jgi:pimeloyl-ACP methyl ester carboxylesterase
MSFTKTRQRYSSFKRWFNHRLRIRKKLHVEVIDGPGDPIVFLHGIASNTKVWELVIKPLRGKHKLVLVDMLGFGESIAPDTIKYDVGDHVYAISHGLKKAGIKKPAYIVGHSMGSIVATHFAAVYPKKVLGLVLCSLPIYKRSELSDQKLRSWQKDTDEMYFRVYRILRHRKDFAVKTAAMLHKLGIREIELKEHSWYAFSESLKNTIEHQNVEADIKKIKVPIDIIYGKFDILVISKHLEDLRKYDNIRVYKTNSRHDLTEGYSHKISQLVERSVSAK